MYPSKVRPASSFTSRSAYAVVSDQPSGGTVTIGPCSLDHSVRESWRHRPSAPRTSTFTTSDGLVRGLPSTREGVGSAGGRKRGGEGKSGSDRGGQGGGRSI